MLWEEPAPGKKLTMMLPYQQGSQKNIQCGLDHQSDYVILEEWPKQEINN